MWEEVTPIGSALGFEKYIKCFVNKQSKIKVIRSITTLENGSRWIHVSCSKKIGQIVWKDLQSVKNQFIGSEKEAIQVFPKIRNLIDISDCYHLWSLLDGEFCIPDLNKIIGKEPF